MIGQITGILLEKNPPLILLDCNGIAYEINVSMNTFYDLPNIHQTVKLFTQFFIRDNEHLLYGFISNQEKQLFKLLITVNKVGPKIALALLSSLNVTELLQAITLQEVKFLAKVPGIGKKTAERLLLELKDKIQNIAGYSQVIIPENNNHSDILQALLTLGYSEKEALLSLKSLPKNTEVSEGIKLSLKFLSK